MVISLYLNDGKSMETRCVQPNSYRVSKYIQNGMRAANQTNWPFFLKLIKQIGLCCPSNAQNRFTDQPNKEPLLAQGSFATGNPPWSLSPLSFKLSPGYQTP
jgi:hypothetical protein